MHDINLIWFKNDIAFFYIFEQCNSKCVMWIMGTNTVLMNTVFFSDSSEVFYITSDES